MKRKLHFSRIVEVFLLLLPPIILFAALNRVRPRKVFIGEFKDSQTANQVARKTLLVELSRHPYAPRVTVTWRGPNETTSNTMEGMSYERSGGNFLHIYGHHKKDIHRVKCQGVNIYGISQFGYIDQKVPRDYMSWDDFGYTGDDFCDAQCNCGYSKLFDYNISKQW